MYVVKKYIFIAVDRRKRKKYGGNLKLNKNHPPSTADATTAGVYDGKTKILICNKEKRLLKNYCMYSHATIVIDEKAIELKIL